MKTFEFIPAQVVDLQNAPTFGTFNKTFGNLVNVSFSYAPALAAVLLLDNIQGKSSKKFA